MLKNLLILFTVAFIAGCAATGPVYVDAPLPKGSDALVYIYRPSNLLWGARNAYFYVNDVNIVDLSSNGYTWFHIPAGEYSFKQKWSADIRFWRKNIVIPVKWAPRERIYYRLVVSSDYGFPIMTFRWNVTQVPEVQALEEIKDCNLQLPFGINDLLGQLNRK